MFTKGADDVVEKLLDEEKSVSVEDVKHQILKLSKNGLRVMMLCYKEITWKEFIDWQEKYLDSKKKQNKVMIKQLENTLEKRLILIGAAALRDELQDKIVKTIEFIHKSKIKIWMVTGDKMETVERIGISTGIIQ